MLLYRKYKLSKQKEDFTSFLAIYKETELGLKQFECELGPKKLASFCAHYGERNTHMINSLAMIGWTDLQGPQEAASEDQELKEL